MGVNQPSRIGTLDPMDTKTRVYVDADLNEVSPGSSDAAFVYARSDLDRVKSRREELGLGGDEVARVQAESAKKALAAAERRAAEAAAEVTTLTAVVKANETKAAKDTKSTGKASAKTDDEDDEPATSGKG